MTIAIQDGGHMKTRFNRLGVAARRSAVVVVAVGSSMALSMTSASAAASTGSCSKDGYFANYSVDYHYAGGYDYIDRYNWSIGHGERHIGNRNNVEARTKHDKTAGGDPIYHTWISEDNVKAGDGSHPVGNGIKVPGNERMYVEYKFTFDKPGGGDPKCDGHTTNV